MSALYIATLVDPETGARLDTFDGEMTEAQLEAYLALAHEEKPGPNGETLFRFDGYWGGYMGAGA